MEDSILTQIKTEHQFIFEALKMTRKSDLVLRHELYVVARDALVNHLYGEERSIFRHMLEEISDPKVRTMVEKLEHHHQLIREYLQKLNLISPSSQTWMKLFDELEVLVHSHCRSEEKELFAEAKEDYTREELADMMTEFVEAHHTGPNSVTTSV